MSIIAWGKGVLLEESAALKSTAEKLGEPFRQAIECLLEHKGKVIVTGLGKSGHVARKIAATLASTGSSAFYVHPSEALHGDSGMIQKDDCLLAIAYSGETPEVIQVAEMSKRLGLPVLSITGKIQSTLAGISDVVLDGSVECEADPLNIVPTSSSTVALALGDAVAVALMRSRGFSESDFGRLHPGGSLGKKLARVDTFMCKPKRMMIDADEKFSEVLLHTSEENFGIIGVCEQNTLVGVITDGDLRRSILKHGENIFERSAKDLMSKSPKSLSSTALVAEALNLMETHKITSVYVYDKLDKQRIIGLIRMHDLVSAKLL